MTKTYAQQCLERANEASPGPWGPHESGHYFEDGPWQEIVCIPLKKTICKRTHGTLIDMEFIQHARMDVVELAKRLDTALRVLKLTLAQNHDLDPEELRECEEFIEELERPLE